MVKTQAGQLSDPASDGRCLIGFSSLMAVSLQNIGIFYREVKNPGALVYNSLGYQFGSYQEPSLFIDFELERVSKISLSLIL